MTSERSFADWAVVACGTLRPELEALQEEGFMDAKRVLLTAPGLHERPPDLEEQLSRQLAKADAEADRVLVLYGEKCFVDYSDPFRHMDALLREQLPSAVRVSAKNCVDMLAGAQEREQIADGQRNYWLTPGWVKYWRHIFRDWDTGKANETFPQNDRAVLLDGVGFFEQWSQEKPEELLAFSDWMRIPIEPHPIELYRFRQLLLKCLD